MSPGAFDKKRLAEERKLVASSSPVEEDAQQGPSHIGGVNFGNFTKYFPETP
jgi:hypothetical protein